MEFNANDVAKKIMDAIQKEYKELKTLNVMILGKTGVGKSTLINNMFNKPRCLELFQMSGFIIFK